MEIELNDTQLAYINSHRAIISKRQETIDTFVTGIISSQKEVPRDFSYVVKGKKLVVMERKE